MAGYGGMAQSPRRGPRRGQPPKVRRQDMPPPPVWSSTPSEGPARRSGRPRTHPFDTPDEPEVSDTAARQIKGRRSNAEQSRERSRKAQERAKHPPAQMVLGGIVIPPDEAPARAQQTMATVKYHHASQEKAQRTVQAVQALELRIAGHSYDAIGRLMRMPRAAASDLCEFAIQETLREPAEAVRMLELARLDKLLLGIWEQATTPGTPGQLEAMDRVLKIMGQRTHYILGVDVKDAQRQTERLSTDQVLGLLHDVAYAVRSTLLERFPASEAREILEQMQARTQVLEASFKDMTTQAGAGEAGEERLTGDERTEAERAEAVHGAAERARQTQAQPVRSAGAARRRAAADEVARKS